MKINKGDTVQVITGKDKGQTARSSRQPRDRRHGRGRQPGHPAHHGRPVSRGSRTGGLVVQEAPIHVSNVAVVDPSDNKPTRIKTRVETARA